MFQTLSEVNPSCFKAGVSKLSSFSKSVLTVFVVSLKHSLAPLFMCCRYCFRGTAAKASAARAVLPYSHPTFEGGGAVSVNQMLLRIAASCLSQQLFGSLCLLEASRTLVRWRKTLALEVKKVCLSGFFSMSLSCFLYWGLNRKDMVFKCKHQMYQVFQFL